MRRVALFSALILAAFMVGAAPAAAHSRAAGPVQEHVHARGGLDCNGFSPIQKPVRRGMACTEIAANTMHGFEDNGHYIGHDEPAAEFFSSKAGSGGSESYQVKLPVEPGSKPNGSFTGPVGTFQTGVTFWFGMVLCDNQSYPEGTKVCTPNSDANIQVPPRPDHAGAAFLEVQFYPPGRSGFGSCDLTHWCAALTIDSLQAQFGALHGPGNVPGAISNPNCAEPVNFAYLTKSGTPIGPPGPDTQTNQSFKPTNNVLRMNQGDVITVNIHDTAAGLSAAVTDQTTGGSGSMVASVANGFRHILFDPVHLTCNGAPYAFHPMYNTAAAPTATGQPTAWTTWAAHTFNISESGEIGHFEPVDGDGDDSFCIHGPVIPGCTGTDTDFDGYAYHADWPNGSANFATAAFFSSPRSLGPTGSFNQPFRTFAFETDLPRVEEANTSVLQACNHHTGQNCTNPPVGASFYPWIHLASVPGFRGGCAWALSNDLPNQISNFGGEQAAWGPLLVTNYGFDTRIHNFASTPAANPCG
jgi:hypothetical protein